MKYTHVVPDPLTGLPLLGSVHARVRAELKRHGEIGFVFFDIAGFHQLQGTYGKKAGERLLALLGRTLDELRGILFREEDLVAVQGAGEDCFVLFLFSPPRRKPRFSNHDLKLIRHRILNRLTDLLNEQRERLDIQEPIDLYSGYTLICAGQRMSAQKLIAEAHKEAAFKAQLDDLMVGFIGHVSHELRTPLTCIEGYAETLLEGAMSDPELCRRWLQIIFDEAQRLERLIKDLLDLSVVETQQLLRLRQVDIQKLIEDTAAVVHPYAQKSGVKVTVDAPEGLPPVLADEDRIRQVLFNLVDNAIKYSRPRDRVRIQARCSNGQVSVSVIDSGPGIPEPEVERVFERFYRVGKGRGGRKSGRGLGLAIAKHFIEAHGGTISVKSKVDRGSTFQFTLPVEEGPGEESL